MGGGSGGPITGELIRGVPGKGEGPLVPALPTPSIAVEGEEVLGSLLIKDATAGPISGTDILPGSSGGLRGAGGPSTIVPNSPLAPSLRGAERGRAGTSIICVGDGFPPLTGDGPEEPSLLNGPRRGGICRSGLPGVGFTMTGL